MRIRSKLVYLTGLSLLFSCTFTTVQAQPAPAGSPTPRPTWGTGNGDLNNDDRLRTQAPTAPTSDSEACFSGKSTVHVKKDDKDKSKGSAAVAMSDLQIGDWILTAAGGYEAVTEFLHFDRQGTTEFLQIKTKKTKQPLEISGGHLLFVHGKTNPVRADSIVVGDFLQTVDKESPAKVTKIQKVQRTGLFAPLTASGTLMVNGIQASAYVSLQDNIRDIDEEEYMMWSDGMATWASQHDFVHKVLPQLRRFCQRILGDKKCLEYGDDGMPLYISYALKFFHWANELHYSLQALIFVLISLLYFVALNIWYFLALGWAWWLYHYWLIY